MHKYAFNEIPANLEPWPFDNPDSDYRILRGNPSVCGRLDYGAGDGQHRLGIWACTEGAFECTELGDELQTILRGRLPTRIEITPPTTQPRNPAAITRKNLPPCFWGYIDSIFSFTIALSVRLCTLNL